MRGGLKVYTFPIELGKFSDLDTDLTNVLRQIRAHPKVIGITATKPVKDMITQEEFRSCLCDNWTINPAGLESANEVFLRRKCNEVSAEAHNKDGQAFVNAYKNHWSESIRSNILKGKKVVILGFGGTGQAIVDALLSPGKDSPATIVASNCQRSFAKAERIFLDLY